jgi:hypothetical protein
MENGSNSDENLQIIYRWKALTKENSLKQLFLKIMHCTSLASEEKEIGCKIQLSDLGINWTNWQFRRHYVGPTIQLGPLLASISYYLHNFLNEMGAQDHELSLTVSMNWRLRREKLGLEEQRQLSLTATLAIQIKECLRNKHNINLSVPLDDSIKG